MFDVQGIIYMCLRICLLMFCSPLKCLLWVLCFFSWGFRPSGALFLSLFLSTRSSLMFKFPTSAERQDWASFKISTIISRKAPFFPLPWVAPFYCIWSWNFKVSYAADDECNFLLDSVVATSLPYIIRTNVGFWLLPIFGPLDWSQLLPFQYLELRSCNLIYFLYGYCDI